MGKSISRVLSHALRHKPENLGLTLDKGGWVNIHDLLEGLENSGHDVDIVDLLEIVETNDKKRFEIDDDGDKIRASQGHSVKVDLGLKNERPPMKLYHGTVGKFIEFIKEDGLLKMNRHAVHLSEDLTTANKVGSRRGEAIILTVNSGAMHADNIKFTKSKNGVWLTDIVDPKYIKF